MLIISFPIARVFGNPGLALQKLLLHVVGLEVRFEGVNSLRGF